MRVLIALVLVVASACGKGDRPGPAPSKSTHPRYDFRGIHLGDSVSSAVAAAQKMKCDSVGCAINHDSLAGVEAFTFVELFDGRVVSVVVTFPTEGFETVAQLSREKWGQPTTSEVDTLTTRMGAKFPRRRLVWQMAEGRLRVDEMSDRVTEGAIVIVSDSLSKLRDARDSVRIKKAAQKVL